MTDEELTEISLEAGIKADMDDLRWFYNQIIEDAANVFELNKRHECAAAIRRLKDD